MEQGKAWHSVGMAPDGSVGNANYLGYSASSYERRFIDDYLALRHYDLTDENRAIVARGMEQYGAGNMVLPNELIVYLDNLYRDDGL